MATAAEVFRDYVTDGVPSSGAKKPKKSEIRAWGKWLEDIITAFTSNGGVIYSSLSALNADLAKAANTMAWVVEDATAANNGVYRKVGASGAGSWTRVADLPYSFIVASDSGAGTPDAIQASTSIPVSGSALVLLNIFEGNTGSPVTVSFNGGAPLTIKTNSGNDIAPGGLVSGMLVMGRISGSTFRIVTDQVSGSIVSAAEAAQAAAEAARDEAVAAAAGVSLPLLAPGNAGKTLLVNPASNAYVLGANESRLTLDLTYGADPTGVSDCADAFEAAAAAGGVVYVRKGTYKLTSVVNVTSPVTFIFEAGVQINVTHDGAGFAVTSNDVRFIGIGPVIINGPRTGTDYLLGSRAFSFDGTSGTQYSRFTVRGLEMRNFKEGAIRATYVNDIVVEDNFIHDCTYMGCFFLSCQRSFFDRNRVRNIAPGTSGASPYLNAYGVSWTAGSSSDTMCIDFWCRGNDIGNVISWTGIDTHGGQNGVIVNNRVTGCYIGIGATILNTVAPNYIEVSGNYVQGHPLAGVVTAAGTVFPGPGISLAGVQGGQRTQGNKICNNRLVLCGYYNGSNFFAAIMLQSTQGTICEGNTLISCRSIGIGAYYVNFGLMIARNIIQELDTSGSDNPIAIWVSSTTNIIGLHGNALILATPNANKYLYSVLAQDSGYAVVCSRDSWVKNATKWAGSSATNCTDIGGAL